MKKTIRFPVDTTTRGEIEINLHVPEEFLDEDGEVFDDDGLCDWLNDNRGEWYDIVPVFEEIQSKEAVEIANVY
ncbi:hypothetical protein [Streptomyces sp. NPDC094031]|uniref:hypothetical protein n=1 Tax=Streptomyces sp. NPDC094031 TaxID=3155307 RepID=UPI0033302901